jgi:adenylyl-sulfate kinase
VTPANRARAIGQTPMVVWLTGLSGAGKTTVADLLDRRLHSLGRHSIVLDGDNLRHGLTADLGFSDADRSENIRRVGHAAALMADAGLIVIVSLISPFREDRQRAREAVGTGRFIEVFVDAPLDICRQRDPKGMYARALAGDLPRFTGIGAAYEPPEKPDLHLRTDTISPEQAVEQILVALNSRRTGR